MKTAKELLQAGEGVLHLMPAWVPRPFNEPGRRLRLHPDDYFAYGMHRGGITERWIASVKGADNGPETSEYEGMSFAVDDETDETMLLKDIVDALGAELIGQELIDRYGTWPTYTKFFDNDKPLFHHVHLMKKDAERIGAVEKPEAYYFPVQYNSGQMGRMPLTYFGFDPSTTKEQVMACLRDYNQRDTRITELSRGYRVQLGTGWYTPAGVVHAPASVCTYEPQWNADTNTIMENVTMGEVNAAHFLTDCLPEGEKDNLEMLFGQLDWEECTRPDYKAAYFRAPKTVSGTPEGVTEKWVTYANPYVAAKEVTVRPGETAVITEPAAHDVIVIEGHGRLGKFKCEAPHILRFGQKSADEFFISEAAAKKGIKIVNESEVEPLVFLQHFANNHPDTPQTV